MLVALNTEDENMAGDLVFPTPSTMNAGSSVETRGSRFSFSQRPHNTGVLANPQAGLSVDRNLFSSFLLFFLLVNLYDTI